MRILFLFLCLTTVILALENHADEEVISAEKHIPVHKPRGYKKRQLEDGDELLLSQVVWRHGDRAPTGTYPTDPHKEDAWPNGWGELTQLGMRQQYALGRLLFKRYVNATKPLLKNSYNSKEVYIRSTDVNRTLVSALSNLAGMFENGNRGADYPDSKRWPTNWTPIPIHTLAEKDDPKFVAENQKFLDFVSEKTGKKVIMPEVYMVNDVHYIEKLYNMSQPDWITDDVEIKLRNLSQVSTRFLFGIGDPYVPELIRLRGGTLTD
uniref:Histidine acid phosphatase n=1 Tax=Caenorhabditis tropicalis TaxID=1561998 RepID=A0A1I7UGD1_9PELO